MFFDEFLKIEPNDKQLSSRIYHIKECLDLANDALDAKLFNSINTITNLCGSAI